MSKRFPWIDNLSTAQQLGVLSVLIVVGVGIVALKAWLLVLVLGWIGITALGFWKAVVTVVLLDLLLASVRR